MGLELNSKHPAQSFSVGSDSLLDAVIERVWFSSTMTEYLKVKEYIVLV